VKKKPAFPLGPVELRRDRLPLFRYALISAAYICAFILLDLFTKQVEELPGIVTWYPPAGLTYTLLLAFGVSFAPAVTIALLISSIFIYRMPQPLYLLFLWALIISLIYAAAAAFLRRRIRFDWRLRKLRDMAWLVAATVLVSALLAVLSVSSSALSSNMPRGEVLRAIFDWWIGETVGVLTLAPFLFVFVIPGLKRFAEGQPVGVPGHRSVPRPRLSTIGQAASIAFVLYWVFGAPVLDEFHPLYLLILPLIWIALQRGFKGVSAGILALNSGMVLAMWLFRFDLARLGELELLMIVNCIVGLLMGAIVTERRLAGTQLVEHHATLNALLESAATPVFSLDRYYRYTSFNSAHAAVMKALYGAEIEIGQSMLEYQAVPEDREGARKNLDRALRGEQVVESSYSGEPGRARSYFEVTHNPIRDTTGEVVGVSVFVSDLTERKQKEEELRQSEARFRILFERAADIILQLEITPEGIPVIREANSATFKILGYERDELIGQPMSFIEAASDALKVIDQRRQNVLSGMATVFEVRHRCKDGTIRDFESSVAEMQVGSKTLAISVERDITERKLAEKKIQRQLEELSTLSGIDRIIAANFDLQLSLSEILNHVTIDLRVDAADIFLSNPNFRTLEFGAERGFRTEAVRKVQIHLGENYAGRVALERRFVQIPNLRAEPVDGLLPTHLTGEDFICYYGVPLIMKGQVKGVLEVFHRSELEPDGEWFDFLNALAGQAAIAIDISTLFESLQRSNLELHLAYDATIEGWSHALDLRDKETEGHTQRVTETTVELARAFGLSDVDLVQVRWGALLHDIGMMGVPDEILHKPGPLTDEEWVAMKKHPTFAYKMLSPIRYLRLALDIPYCHHEKWDGGGYPRGLKGVQIPLVARIFSVVDVWDALRSDRPYRAAWKEEKVREFILSSSGTHFDPHVVEVFMRNIDSFEASLIPDG
jgi:PAS domain S-box-containing protein